MADPNGNQTAPVVELGDLLQRARELGFFGFVSLVERLAGSPVRVGADGPSADEPVRFWHDPLLTFNASDFTSVRRQPGDTLKVHLTTSFLGLTGAVTPLPLYLAEELADEDAGAVQRGFLDLFHHRLLSLLYRAYVKYQLGAEATTLGTDAWAQRLLALAGVDARTQAPSLDRGTLLTLLPALVSARRSPEALQAALEVVLGRELPEVPVHVEPFVGQWSALDRRDVCRLGVANSRLGTDLVLGSRMFDRAGKFRVEIGPVDAGAFARLSAGSPLRATIDAVVALFVNDFLAHDVVVTVDQTRQRLKLSGAGNGSRLGQDSWLGHYDRKTSSVRLGERGPEGSSPGKAPSRS